MPYKGEETSDLVRKPQTRERTVEFCALCASDNHTLRRHVYVCVRKRKRGSVALCIVKQAGARDKKYTQSRERSGGPVRRRAAGSCGPLRASDNGMEL